jgi:UDP-N-acetylglucosamine acyltransferase
MFNQQELESFIHPDAQIADNVSIGPFCYIGSDVVIDQGCILESHVVIKGPTRIGKNNHFYQFSSIGEACQDQKYQGEPTELIIGNHNIFRESCTVHRGTTQDQSMTVIGNHNLFMAYVHIAHDCIIGDHVIMSNNASLAGHVRVDNHAILAGMVGVHQFVQIGMNSFVAGGSVVRRDVPPFVMAEGPSSAVPKGLNLEGMKRSGLDADSIRMVKRAYRILYRSGLKLEEAQQEIKSMAVHNECVAQLSKFLMQSSNRGIIR